MIALLKELWKESDPLERFLLATQAVCLAVLVVVTIFCFVMAVVS